MSTATIEKALLAVQISGQGYYVAIPQDRLMMLVQLAESLTDGGKIVLQSMPLGHSLIELNNDPHKGSSYAS